MIWTGVLLLGFIVYHILHFTARVTPDIVQGVDVQGRFDVFKMVTTSFHMGGIALIYVAAMIVLFLHLSHGVQSFFQTMGWANDKAQPVFQKLGKVLSFIFLFGYSSIPVFILAGILKG
jgi:succinate dehydrogenase / fumarate reductase cytochrome b subunit